MIEVTRRLQFSAGHRVVGHEGKCKYPHGHNYVVYVHARAKGSKPLDNLGRVIDFGILKQKIGDWIEEFWDHGFIVWQEDKELLDGLSGMGGKIFLFPDNPTAELLASYLLYDICPMLIEDPIQIFRVDIQETENCMAVVEISHPTIDAVQG